MKTKKPDIGFKLPLISFILGGLAIILSFLIVFVIYKNSVKKTEQDIYKFYRSKALILKAIIEEHPNENDSVLLEHVLRLYNSVEKQASDEYLCIVNEKSNLILHSLYPNSVGNYAGKNTVFDQRREVCSLGDLVQIGENYLGHYISSSGEKQIAAFEYIPSREWMLGVHRSQEELQKEIKAQYNWFLIALIIIIGGLIPFLIINLFSAFKRSEDKKIAFEKDIQFHLQQKNEEYEAINEELRQANEEIYLSKQKVLESEEYFRTLIENSSDVIAILDIKGNVAYESPAHEKVLGYSTGELLGRNAFELVHPEDIERISQQFIQLIKNENGIEQVNFRLLHKNGSWIQIEGTGKNLIHSTRINGIIINYRDITERIKAEQALKESEEQFRSLIENSNDVIAILDINGNVAYESPSHEKVLGYSIVELLGKNAFQFVHPEDVERISLQFMRLLKSEKGIEYVNFRVLHKNGTWLHVEGTGKNLLHSPRIRGIVYNYRDVTERKKTEESLMQTTSFMSKIIDSSALNTWISDENGTAVMINPACLSFFGTTKEEVIGKYNLFKDEVIKAQGFTPDIKRVFEKGEAANIIIDYDFSTVDHVGVRPGSHKVINSILTPVLDSESKVSNVIVQSIDLTDIKNAEAELIKAKEKAEENDRLKSAFLANMSHEIRTPMNGIIGFAKLLQKHDMSEDKLSKYIDIIVTSSNQLLSIVNDILDISRIETGQIELYENKINLNATLESIKTFFDIKAGEKQIKLNLHCESKNSESNILIKRIPRYLCRGKRKV